MHTCKMLARIEPKGDEGRGEVNGVGGPVAERGEGECSTSLPHSHTHTQTQFFKHSSQNNSTYEMVLFFTHAFASLRMSIRLKINYI